MKSLITFAAITLVTASALSGCGTTRDERAATGAVGGAVVAGPVGAAVGAAGGAVVSAAPGAPQH